LAGALLACAESGSDAPGSPVNPGVGAAAGQPTAVAAPPAEDGARITGFAFVDSSVTGQGSAAQLPSNAQIFPPGTRVTGTTGCPSSSFRTDGLIVAVIDYRGRPTAGSVTVSAVPAPQFGGRPPYYLDLDTGRTLQFLGPVVDNGTYRVTLDYYLGQAQARSTAAEFALDRNCPQR
jgi:hypothetical protein